MSPLEIAIALHYYWSPAPYNGPVDDCLFSATIDKLLRAGLLRELDEPNQDGSRYERTEGLICYCEALCAMPFPVQRWVMPDD
jgi:hypothetical protein